VSACNTFWNAASLTNQQLTKDELGGRSALEVMSSRAVDVAPESNKNDKTTAKIGNSRGGMGASALPPIAPHHDPACHGGGASTVQRQRPIPRRYEEDVVRPAKDGRG